MIVISPLRIRKKFGLRTAKRMSLGTAVRGESLDNFNIDGTGVVMHPLTDAKHNIAINNAALFPFAFAKVT